MPLSKRSRGERDAPGTSKPTGLQKHLYLILDDWDYGYSIRELNLSNDGAGSGAEQRRPLPPPFIRLEATRRRPEFFAAVGTKILATHPYFRYDTLEPGGILTIVDVRSRGVYLAPGELYPRHPIFIPVGADEEIFALDMHSFKVLSMNPPWPPRQEFDYKTQVGEWSWHDLPMPTLFNRMDVTSYAVGSNGRTILVSTAAATFAFDPLRQCHDHGWEKRADWSLPFSGHAHFVDSLNLFVGLPPKDDALFGHLCFCRWFGGDDDKHVWFSKENLSSKQPAENHVGTTLVYLGETRFCLVECISNGDYNAVEKWLKAWEDPHPTEELIACPCPSSTRCHLTTFSLSSDMNGDLTVAKTAVQCYEVPPEASFNVNPVAFGL